MHSVPPPPDALSRLRAAGEGVQLLSLAWVGVEAGIFNLIAAQPSTPDQIAAARGLDPAYAQRWAEAALAFGLVEEEPSGPPWTLRPSAEGALLCAGQPGLPLAVGTGLTAHLLGRLPGLMRSGDRPGEVVLGEDPAVAPFFGAMLEAGFGAMLRGAVLPAVPAYAQQLEDGGLVVDLGCGNGWFLRGLLRRFPQARGFGIDGMDANIADGAARAAAEGLADRLTLARGDLLPLPETAPPALICLNRALHHVWDRRAELLAAIAAALAPGGAVVIWEPAWPADPRELAAPGRRGLAWNNLAEHVQGNHLLRPDQIEQALRGAGFHTETTPLPGGDVVIVGRRDR
jgi:SAM-dependent methyltransferase